MVDMAGNKESNGSHVAGNKESNGSHVAGNNRNRMVGTSTIEWLARQLGFPPVARGVSPSILYPNVCFLYPNACFLHPVP